MQVRLKAFDRVHYCKLFRLLINKGLPACIVRVLAVLYTSSQVRVLWAGLVSDYFPVPNGVKQGEGVISPVLFCVYIDDLLLRLSSAGVDCYLGLNYVGALAYADDIVLYLLPLHLLCVNYFKYVMLMRHQSLTLVLIQINRSV